MGQLSMVESYNMLKVKFSNNWVMSGTFLLWRQRLCMCTCLQGLDPSATEPLTQDRDEWRALVKLVGSTHDSPCTRHDDDLLARATY